MLRVRAFRGLVPAPHLAHLVASVPYDVVDREEAATLAADNPYSLLRVDRAELELPPDTDPYSDAVYARAAANFARLQAECVLQPESAPTIYLYRQRMGSHTQIGVAAVCHIEDYESGTILRHEKTRPDKEEDRTRLISTLSADTGPVFLTYRNREDLDALVGGGVAADPDVEFTAPDGVEHAVWKVVDATAFERAFREVPKAYVADGHHRTASAVRVGNERRAANPAHDGTEEYNWFLAVLFPASQLQILPYNRVVADLNGLLPEAFQRLAGEVFQLEATVDPSPSGPRDVRMFLAGKWHRLSWPAGPAADPVASLDISVLQDRLLAPVLGIDDPRTSKRIGFVGGIRGTGELEGRVRDGAAVAFSLHPVAVDQLMAIADAGQIMPPKSTWFEPKLRSGLFIHRFEPAARGAWGQIR